MIRIISKILIICAIFLLIALPIYAQKETITLVKNATIDKDYFAFGEKVEVFGTVNGDTYVGGGNVVVDGQINGDLLLGGGNVIISGNIQGDARIGGGNITFSGAKINGNVTVGGGNVTIDNSTEIQGSLVGGGGNLQINSPIGRGATIGGASVLLANSIGGDVVAGVGELTISPNTVINGDLTYYSEKSANISDSASISGEIKKEIPKQANDVKAAAAAFTSAVSTFLFFMQVYDILLLLVLGLLIIYFFPNFTSRISKIIQSNLGNTILIGLITLILVPIICIILFVTIIGIPISIIFFFLFLLITCLSRIFAINAIGQFALRQSKNKASPIWTYVIGLIIYVVLTIIPIVGFLVQLFTVFVGIGALLITKKEYYTELRAKKII